MIGFILLAVSLICLGIASYTDIRTKEVPDELSIAYIVAALFIRLGYSLYIGQPAFFLEPLGVALIFTAFSYALFLSKQWGGGDLLIFIGLGVSFGTLPADLQAFFSPISAPWPFWVTIMLNLLLVGAIYGTLALLVIVSRRSGVRAKYFSEMRTFLPVMASAIIFFTLFSLFVQKVSFPFLFAILLLLALLKFAQVVEKNVFIKEVAYGELREEDWIEQPIVVGKKVIVPAESPGLTRDDLEKIKALVAEGKLAGTTKIKEGIPFIPVFPLALACSIVMGDIMSGLVVGLFTAI